MGYITLKGRFNSNMVQLRVVIASGDVTVEACFNSNMVQLREKHARTRTYYRRFQFQYGTIKRHQPEKKKRKKVVSIPIWYN